MQFEIILRSFISFLGAVFSILSFIIIFKGKKVGDDGKGKNTLQFKGVKLQTNSVLLVLILSMVVLTLPLVLPYFAPQNSDVLSDKFAFNIQGIVENKQQRPLANVVVECFKKDKTGKETKIDAYTTDSQGLFYLSPKDIFINEHIYLLVKRAENQREQKEAIIPINHKVVLDTDAVWADN